MANLMKKRSTFVVLVIVIALLSITMFAQFDGRTGPPTGSSTNSSTPTSSTQQNPTSTTSTSARVSTVMQLGKAYNSLFATPTVMLNYSIRISQYEATGSKVTLSAASPIPGVTLTLNPKEFTFQGTQVDVYIGISVAPTVNSSILPVEITARTANGATNSTFDFTLNRALVVILPSGVLTPPVLHVNAGQTVTWLNLADNSDANGQANVILPDGSAPSPTMGLNGVWSHTFGRPGTYPYHIDVSQYPTTSGIIVVA